MGQFYIGVERKARRCYGFDEIALVPGRVTIDPADVDTSWSINGKKFRVPIIAAAMDGVVDVKFAIAMGKLGGIAVLNLEGVQTRYENPEEVLEKIANASPEQATSLVQSVYTEPIKEKLVSRRIEEIKKAKVPAIVSAIPQRAERFGAIAQESGADAFVVQSTVSTVKHVSKNYKVLDFKKFCAHLKIPVIIGNCVTYEVALDLLNTGCSGLLVGIGPGAACTTRGVLGYDIPDRLAPGKERHEPVKPECDTAVRRSAVFKSVEQKSEPQFCLIVAYAYGLEYKFLHLPVMYPYASGTYFGTVDHKVIGPRPY